MFKVVIKNDVSLKIDEFLENYSNIFLDRFSDTGIFSENVIRWNFIKSVKNIRNEVFEKIESELSQELIFWYKEISKTTFQFYTSIEKPRYRLKIEYSEDLKETTRFIEKIEFHKK